MKEFTTRLTTQLREEWNRVREEVAFELMEKSVCSIQSLQREVIKHGQHERISAPNGMFYDVKVEWPNMSDRWGEPPDLTVRIVATPHVKWDEKRETLSKDFYD